MSSAASASASAHAPSGGPRRALYVGGLDESVTLALLQAAFVPFGELSDVQLPLDVATGKPRGFGFVQFAEEADAADAVENMDGAELCGRTIRVNAAKPMKGKSAWADSDEWYAKLKAAGELEDEAGEAGGEASGEAAVAAAAAGAAAPPR